MNPLDNPNSLLSRAKNFVPIWRRSEEEKELWEAAGWLDGGPPDDPVAQDDIAFHIAQSAHRGHFRKDGKTPYFTHPYNVADRLRQKGKDLKTIALGYLHDVLEDTTVTEQDLLEHGIEVDVVKDLRLLTKRKDGTQTYNAYLDELKLSKRAREVKIEDMLDNLSSNPSRKQILKYAHGLIRLLKFEKPEEPLAGVYLSDEANEAAIKAGVAIGAIDKAEGERMLGRHLD